MDVTGVDDENQGYWSDALHAVSYRLILLKIPGDHGIPEKDRPRLGACAHRIRRFHSKTGNAMSAAYRLIWFGNLYDEGHLDFGEWFFFGGQDIETFHILLRAALDELAALFQVIENNKDLPKSFTKLRNRREKLRPTLSPEAYSLLDQASWYDDFVNVRDEILHGEATTILFGSDKNEKGQVLFQIHKQGWRGMIGDRRVFYNDNGVVDFRKYCTVLLGELFLLSDGIGRLAAERFPLIVNLEERLSWSGHPFIRHLRAWTEDCWPTGQ
jgi:hypothetical protein